MSSRGAALPSPGTTTQRLGRSGTLEGHSAAGVGGVELRRVATAPPRARVADGVVGAPPRALAPLRIAPERTAAAADAPVYSVVSRALRRVHRRRRGRLPGAAAARERSGLAAAGLAHLAGVAGMEDLALHGF